MVLGGDYNASEARRFGRCGPLAAVQVRGVEQVFRLLSAPPFLSAESVGAKVAEHVHFHFLPFQLRPGGLWYGVAGKGQQKYVQKTSFHESKITNNFIIFEL
jgi:hypothetical protein